MYLFANGNVQAPTSAWFESGTEITPWVGGEATLSSAVETGSKRLLGWGFSLGLFRLFFQGVGIVLFLSTEGERKPAQEAALQEAAS